MAINLKAVLDGQQGQTELSVALAAASAQLRAEVASKRSKGDLGKLQGQLQKIFYPTGITAISTDYYNERTGNATSKNLVEIFEGFNFESNATGHHNAKTAISPNTLAASLKSAQMQLDSALQKMANQDTATSSTHLTQILQECQQLINQGSQILASAEIVYQFGQPRIAGTSFEQALVIVNKLSAFSKVLSSKDFVSPQDAGILFEKALAMTNFVDAASDAVIDDAIRMLSGKAHYGAETIRRGVGGAISFSANIGLANKKEVKRDKRFRLSKNGMTIDYSYDPGSGRDGKMDVQLHYGMSDMEDYRVSAKRWTRGFGDFGDTSIDAGITRAVGNSVAEAYRFAVLKPRKDQMGDGDVPNFIAAQSAHAMAKLALKSDIVMGLNQGKTASGAGYANILVVDTGSEIKVRDLATIVLEDTYELSKYDEASINRTAINSYAAIKNILTGRSQSYLALMSSALNKMKVTLNYSLK